MNENVTFSFEEAEEDLLNDEKRNIYFEKLGISKAVVQEYFIQIVNVSGNNSILVIKGNKDEMIVFWGVIDMLSFLQLLQLNDQKNNRTLIALSPNFKIDEFFNRYQNFQGKIFLCLKDNDFGNNTTRKLRTEFKGKSVIDIRLLYDISANKNISLNNYLQYKLQIQHKNVNLDEAKKSENGDITPESERVSETQPMGTGILERSVGTIGENSQSEQNGSYRGGQTMGSNDARNGFAGTAQPDLGGRRENRSNDTAQRTDAGKNETGKNSLGGRLLENSTHIVELDDLIEKYKGQKLTNEQVAEVVSVTCFVSDNNKIVLKENLTITDDLKDICNQFQSGGMAKEGRGILDEYYTPDKIVDAVRNLIKNQFANKKEISVLEPSVGTGNFLYAAKDLVIKSKITAFEINETTSKIAKIIHPEAEINLRSFETEFIDEKGDKTSVEEIKKYDLTIGNPPYGEHRGLYKGLGEEPKLSKYEDYFVKRSLDSLKEGGILAMVLPSGWLNRQKNLQNAAVLEAFRLPSGAFSGTQVGTDIVILKKSGQEISENISDYFEKKPQNILGEIREKTNRFGCLENYVDGNLEDALARINKLQNNKQIERIGNLFEDLFLEENIEKETNIPELKPKTQNALKESRSKEPQENLETVKEKIDQVLIKLHDIKFKSPSIIKEIDKYVKLNKEISKKPKSFTAEKLEEIITKADKIIQSHNERTSRYQNQTEPSIKKSVLKYQFTKQDEIVDISLQNNSDITKEEIEAFRDTSYDGTLKNRVEHSQFANFIAGKWIHDFYYAEGNIYAKLEQLERDFSDKYSNGGTENQYEKQKALLEGVLPRPKSLDEIYISPNHEFVHKFGLGQIEKERYNVISKKVEPTTVDYNLSEKFKDFVSNLPSDAFGGSSSWEVRGFVDNETVTGSDKERNALVRERRKAAANDFFYKFVREELSDELRERLVRDFNRNYNNIHVPDYSRFPLFSKIHKNFKGQELRLTEVQKGGIGRLTTKGVGLLAHEVGFGKTLSGVLALHEAMERNIAFRPLIVVPNDSILKQWVETIFETIPDAKVNILGNLGKDYDLSKFNNYDGEITIVTYEGFNNIGFNSDETQGLASKFSYITDSEMKSLNSISKRDMQIELQKQKEVEGKMRRGKIYDWEDFGFDHLTYDEVHNANHIVGKVKIEDRRFASDFRGQNQQTSKLGINTWMICQYIQNRNKDKNVTLLSATPFTNKPLEYYSILSLIANKRLEESGYFNVNTFFETFMEADNDMEIDAKGDVKFKANVRRFKNNSLFQQLLSEFIDIKGEEDNPELIRPNKINKEYKIEQNILTKAQYDLLNENFDEVQKGAILTHILNARLIAISPYLSPYYIGLEPSYKFFVEDSPKLKQTMDLIRQNKKDLPDSGQIIYSELAVKEFPKLKEYLINEVGYKPEEVGIITGATSKNQRISIQNDFNSGKIKFIIGSEAIQEGMNLQENTTDLYLLSLPYNFTSLQQVEGRIWRQGNRNENVRVNFMLTNDSIDVFMLQKLQAKQARYLEAMKKGADVLDVSDISTQELKTSIITNPETRANIEIELMKKRLESEKNKFLADSAFVLRKYEDFLKVKEGVTSAENSYNRILGYSKEEGEDAEYWKSQLTYYQKTIDLAKAEVQKTIQYLAEKGVNVAEIEKQTKASEDIIAKLDEKLENLPEIKDNLIIQYKIEKEEQLKINKHKDHVRDRADENRALYNNLLKVNSIDTMEIKNFSDIVLNKIEDMNLDNVSAVVRKR